MSRRAPRSRDGALHLASTEPRTPSSTQDAVPAADGARPAALELWATIAGVGRAGLVERITRNVNQGGRLAAQIDATPEVELLADPQLNIVAFRHERGGDELNRAIPAVVQRNGNVFVTGTRVRGAEAIRACFMHYGTSDGDVDAIVPAVLAAAHDLMSDGSAQ